jgi:sugar phosphate isomerase/epimerase
MKIGVSSYSYSQYLREGKLDHVSVVAKAKEMGFDGIEFTGLPGQTQEDKLALAAKIVAEAERVDIEITAYCIGANFLQPTRTALDVEVARIKAELDVAKALGVSLMRHDILYALPKGRTFDSIIPELLPGIREVCDYAETLGIKTMFENHGRILQDMDRVEKLVGAIAHKNFGLLIDIGNFFCADEDNVNCVSRLANLALHVHLKDFKKFDYYEGDQGGCFRSRAGNFLKGVAVGDGDARTEQCMHILKDQGYDGYLDIEFEGGGDCVEGIQRGIDFYRSWEAKNV